MFFISKMSLLLPRKPFEFGLRHVNGALSLSLFAILFFFDFALFCSVITGSINHTYCVNLITLSGYLCVS
jgi:hypothetical protein